MLQGCPASQFWVRCVEVYAICVLFPLSAVREKELCTFDFGARFVHQCVCFEDFFKQSFLYTRSYGPNASPI